MRSSTSNRVQKPQYTVTVYPKSLSPHLSQIYSGLVELAYSGFIKLNWSHDFVGTPSSMESTLWVRAERHDDNQTRDLFFDLFDQADMENDQSLNECCTYFKRSYSAEVVDKLSAELGSKVLPFGLNFPCNTNRMFLLPRIQKYLAAFRANHKTRKTNTISKRLAGLTRSALDEFILPNLPGPLHDFVFAQQAQFPPSTYEQALNESSERCVLYRTRLFRIQSHWSDTMKEHATELNCRRIELVTMLRRQLGDSFVGGIYGASDALESCPRECLCLSNTNKRSYIRLLKKCDIAVTSRGLRNSNGWRLAEFCAAGRAIVAEPLAFSLPSPFVDGEHFLSYRSPAECVANCERLLASPEEIVGLRHASFRYYESEIRPTALVANRLRDAFISRNAICDRPQQSFC